MNTNLQSFKKIVNSQWGEDGLLGEIFLRIGTTNKICIEFGAGNGIESSNVWHLIKDLSWNGLLMEGDEDRFAKWKKLMDKNPNFTVLNTFVAINGDNSLENILRRNKMPLNIDLLSVDIDGDDYYIFESLKEYKPRVIIIEHNPTFPSDVEIVQASGEAESFGSSAKSNVLLAKKKGYKLAAVTHGNCIFVIESEFSKLKIDEPRLEDIFDKSGITYLVATYYGATYLRNESNDPSFSYFYNGFSFSACKKSIRSFTFGFTTNKQYAGKTPGNFIPVKILKHSESQNGGLLKMIAWIFKSLKLILNKYVTKD